VGKTEKPAVNLSVEQTTENNEFEEEEEEEGKSANVPPP
jgi:hypothetical protein